MPISTNVSANCPSMNFVAAEAPTGSHQVLATKKYVLAKVISQITAINARPIPQSSDQTVTRDVFPTASCRAPQRKATVGGEFITAQSKFRNRLMQKFNFRSSSVVFPSVLCGKDFDFVLAFLYQLPIQLHAAVKSVNTNCSLTTVSPTEILIAE